MSIELKSFSELGDVYTSSVLLNENKKPDADLGFSKAGKQKGDGPEASAGFNKKALKEKKGPSNKPEKAPVAKVNKESTETSKNMNKKLSFDELYERAMNEGPDSVVQPVVDDEVTSIDQGEGAPEAPFGGEEEEVVAEDPKELFAQLCDLVGKLKEFYGIEDEVEGEDEIESPAGETDIEDLGEAVDAPELPDSNGKALQGKKNDTGGVKVVKGKAATGDVKNEPQAKALGDKSAQFQKKDNKVGGSGAQSKTGASVFETS